MDIIQTCETIELWINSCRTREQLELLEEKLDVYFEGMRFPAISLQEIQAQEDVLIDKIKFRIEYMLFTNPQTIVTNTFTSDAAKS